MTTYALRSKRLLMASLLFALTAWLMLATACVPDLQPSNAFSLTIRVSTLASLRDALAVAAKQSHTTIVFTQDITNTGPTLIVQGLWTVVDLSKHTFIHQNHNTGLPDGAGYGMVVQPSLGDPVPSDGKGILCNPPGSTLVLVRSLGGSDGYFAEPAPCQYADEKLRWTYSQSRSILVPAEHITIKNGTMKLGDPQAVTCLYAVWARDVTFQGLTFNYDGVTEPNCNVGAQECTKVKVLDCDGGGRYFGFNSDYDVTVRRCKNVLTAFEEGVQKVLVEKSTLISLRTNDVACRDFTIQDCTFTQLNVNYGCLALAGIGGNNIVRRNKLLGCSLIWNSDRGNFGILTVEDNTGLAWASFNVYSTKPTGEIDRRGINEWRNSWQKVGG